MKKPAVTNAEFGIGDEVVAISGEYKDRRGIIQRLGSAGEVIYLHVQFDGVNTPITVRTFQVQKGS